MKAVVLDASVGVKWLKYESGSDEALELLRRHGEGEIVLVVPDVFVFEVLDVARRRFGMPIASQLWERLKAEQIAVVPFGGSSFEEVVAVAADLGCSTYDAAAVVVAQAMDARLVSADARAHSGVTGVRILG
jgi:predicted nucleic acid-binding protein